MLPPPKRELTDILTEIEQLLAELRAMYEEEEESGDDNGS